MPCAPSALPAMAAVSVIAFRASVPQIVALKLAAPVNSKACSGHFGCASRGPRFRGLRSNRLLGVSEFLPRVPGEVFEHRSRFASTFGTQRCGLATTSFASDPKHLKNAREDIKTLIRTTFCNPILIRLGWHDAGTYDKNIEEWPTRGGANGSLRHDIELNHSANAGLDNALKLLNPIKENYPNITWADLFQLASATAIEEAGGPKIPMRYGRVDAPVPEGCPPEGKLPAAGPPAPADHLRQVFNRMGLSDKEIVALSGAHTLGRSRPERSGWGKPETHYTKHGPGKPGGQSWTVQWLKFDNSYFKDIKEKKDDDLLVLPTDAVLFTDPGFRIYAERYAEDREVFFTDYAMAHSKLSELGAKFYPPEGFMIDEPSEQLISDKTFAA